MDMYFVLSCTSCKTRLTAPDSAANIKLNCPKCGCVLAVGPPQPIELPPTEQSDKRRPPQRKAKNADRKFIQKYYLAPVVSTVVGGVILGIVMMYLDSTRKDKDQTGAQPIVVTSNARIATARSATKKDDLIKLLTSRRWVHRDRLGIPRTYTFSLNETFRLVGTERNGVYEISDDLKKITLRWIGGPPHPNESIEVTETPDKWLLEGTPFYPQK